MHKTKNEKRTKRITRHKRVRGKVHGSANRPRLSVFRSNNHIWVQLIDDMEGKTLISASDRDIKGKEPKAVKAIKVGKVLAEKALEKNIQQAVFDRGGYRYHGIVEAIADGARKGGLKF